MLRNIKLEIEYDGTNFHGWQVQPKLRTVQGEIEDRINTILSQQAKLVGSGRTDVGVHALGQVANFQTESRLGVETIRKALNGLLPEDIVIRNADEVDLDFNARYSARSRVYSYRICVGRTAIPRRYVWEVLYSLNLDRLLQATCEIEGEHDFSSFCVAASAKDNNTCRIISAFWEMRDKELIFRIEADRFLHTMVRSLVGTLIEVGRGYFSDAEFVDIMKSKDRRKAGPTAPARGLCLVEVKY
ncbi:MAG: tRNA pseudouridine(38-40) synthase TruA [Candidatus Zixiibacteriota bacterium]